MTKSYRLTPARDIRVGDCVSWVERDWGWSGEVTIVGVLKSASQVRLEASPVAAEPDDEEMMEEGMWKVVDPGRELMKVGLGHRDAAFTKRMDHGRYQENLKSKTDVELVCISKDAREAIEAMPDGANASYYADEIAYAGMERVRREKGRLRIRQEEASWKETVRQWRRVLENKFDTDWVRAEVVFWDGSLYSAATRRAKFQGDKEQCLAVFDLMVDRFADCDFRGLNDSE